MGCTCVREIADTLHSDNNFAVHAMRLVGERCTYCVARDAERKAQDAKHAAAIINPANLTPLYCDGCGAHLGYQYDFDMNGNYIYCTKCGEGYGCDVPTA